MTPDEFRSIGHQIIDWIADYRVTLPERPVMAEQVRSTPGWSVLAPVPLQTVCFRHEPAEREDEALDRHTLAWVERVNRSGRAYLTPAILDGRWMVRVSVGAEATEREHVEALWSLIQQEVERIVDEPAV